MRRLFFALSLLGLLVAMPVHAASSPADIYLEYHTALKNSVGDSAIWPFYLDSAREDFQRKFPPELRGRAIYMMKTTTPQQVRVAKEQINGDQATLTLRPLTGDNRLIGTATLRQQDGQWKLEKVIWQQE